MVQKLWYACQNSVLAQGSKKYLYGLETRVRLDTVGVRQESKKYLYGLETTLQKYCHGEAPPCLRSTFMVQKHQDDGSRYIGIEESKKYLYGLETCLESA